MGQECSAHPWWSHDGVLSATDWLFSLGNGGNVWMSPGMRWDWYTSSHMYICTLIPRETISQIFNVRYRALVSCRAYFIILISKDYKFYRARYHWWAKDEIRTWRVTAAGAWTAHRNRNICRVVCAYLSVNLHLICVKGPSTYDICKNFGLLYPFLVRILDWYRVYNSRNLPHSIFFWGNSPPPSVRTSYVDGWSQVANITHSLCTIGSRIQHSSTRHFFMIALNDIRTKLQR